MYFSYKLPLDPINRPWDLSRSIDLVKIYILVDLELHSSYRMLVQARRRSILVLGPWSLALVLGLGPWSLVSFCLKSSKSYRSNGVLDHFLAGGWPWIVLHIPWQWDSGAGGGGQRAGRTGEARFNLKSDNPNLEDGEKSIFGPQFFLK